MTAIMTTLAQWLVILFGVWLIAVSTVMLASPQTAARYLSKAASTNFLNYLELTLRGIWGLALVQYAELSGFPEVFRIFGWFMVVTTAVLFFIPRKWHARYTVWLVKLIAPYMRIASPFSLAFGIFLIYAVV